MILLTLALLTVSAQAQEAKPKALPAGVRCESVKESAVRDLPEFCLADLNKRRLVDYGFQLDVLEICREEELSKNIKIALQAKVHRADANACADLADRLVSEMK